MQEQAIHFKSIIEIAKDIRNKHISPVELTSEFYRRIDKVDKYLNAYQCLCREQAFEQAKIAERQIYQGNDLGPLHGIPFAAKDLFDVKGLATTAGCSLLKNNIASANATSINALFQQGMVLLGKTNTVQFAYSGLGINNDHGTPHNPWQEIEHISGGSSSGSGVAVAAGLSPFAMGTDTAGSVRIPAALCGITGLKPSGGHISKTGVYPLSSTMDSIGPLVRSVADAALIFNVLQETGTTPNANNTLTNLNRGVKGLKLAFAESVFWDRLHPDIEKAVLDSGEIFKELGAKVVYQEFKIAAEAQQLNANGLVVAREAYMANKDLIDNQFDLLDPLVSQRMIKGKDVSRQSYVHLTKEWSRLRASVSADWGDTDVLLVPTTCLPAMKCKPLQDSEEFYTESNILMLRNTAIGNILDLCAISVPCGFTQQGLPIGLMIYGQAGREDLILRVANAFQQSTNWHQATPDLEWIN